MKTAILITGCQRSGTTLMHLVMNSHPEVLSVDEGQFALPAINTYLRAPWLPQTISFKLPQYASLLPLLCNFANFKVLWCIRNPADTVSSMLNLAMPLQGGQKVPWAVHPGCAPFEITNMYWALESAFKTELQAHMNRFTGIARKNPAQCTRSEAVFVAALCWRMKNQLPGEHKKAGIGFHTVFYDKLVADPKARLEEILQYAGLAWSDEVMKHHQLHEGVSIGNTSNTRAIDTQGVGRGARELSPEEIESVNQVCGDVAEGWGFSAVA